MQTQQQIETWAAGRIVDLLGGSLSVDEVRQLLANAMELSSREQTSSFLQDLIGTTPEAVEFIQAFLERRFTSAAANGAWSETAVAARRQQREQQESQMRLILELEADRKSQAAKISNRQAKKLAKEREKMQKVGNAPTGSNGRPICECMATAHGLFGNCLSCGKIMCGFESIDHIGSDTGNICPSCGASVASRQEQRDHSLSNTNLDHDQHRQTNASMSAQPENPHVDSLSVAEAHKNRLLEFDRNSAARTHVHDVASDFDLDNRFNKWASPEERALAIKRLQERERFEEENRRRRVMTIDIQNRKVIIDRDPDAQIHVPDVVQHSSTSSACQKVPSATQNNQSKDQDSEEFLASGAFRNPTLKSAPPVFIPRKPASTAKTTSTSKGNRKASGTGSVKRAPEKMQRKGPPKIQDDFREDLAFGYDVAYDVDFDTDEPVCAS